MPDGYARPAPLTHADGVYLDLPMRDYLRDRALSGSAFKKLAACPPDWWWEHPDNDLWDEPKSDARGLGTMVHCAVLEGLDAYEARYAVKPEPPEGALATCEDLRGALRAVKAELKARNLPGGALIKLSGTRDELVRRVRDYVPDAVIWDDAEDELLAGRAAIGAKADAHVRLVERFIRSDAAYAPLLNNGLAEVSIFWTEGGLRYKARPDYLNRLGVVDLKKFGQPPTLGRSLIQHVLREAAGYGYDVQAVHTMRAVEAAIELIGGDNLEFNAHGPDARARIELCADILRDLRAGPVPFHWLFVRTPGAPVAIAPQFARADSWGNANPIWDGAERKIELAIERFREYRALCGDEMWLRSDGIVTPDVADWPLWTTEIAP